MSKPKIEWPEAATVRLQAVSMGELFVMPAKPKELLQVLVLSNAIDDAVVDLED